MTFLAWLAFGKRLLGFVGLFARSPTEKAALAFGTELADFTAYVEAYPRLAQLVAAGEALAGAIAPAATGLPPAASPEAPASGVDPGLGHGGNSMMRGE